MNGNEIWVWFVAGLMPYHIEHETEPNGRRVLIIMALFWSFTMTHLHSDKHGHWILRIPLIERLRNGAWAVVARLQKEAPPQE